MAHYATPNKYDGKLITIERHIIEQQASFPDAMGILTGLLQDIALSGKLIASHINRAGLGDMLGETGEENVQGEMVQKLDDYANRTIFKLNDHTGRLAGMVSEESEDLIHIPEEFPVGKYILVFDPLDGSSNVNFNVGVGTVFAVYQRVTPNGRPGTLKDALQPGRKVVAAGYIVYGSSTMFVYTTGTGVHGFTLDPSIGEFLLSHPDIQIPEPPKYFSANLGYFYEWSEGVRQYTTWLQGGPGSEVKLSQRYIGSMVGDLHRTLLSGGVFYYPTDPKSPQGKLRLLYEAVPMAFIIEQAGGYASNGQIDILDVQPTELHQRTPLFAGNTSLVKKVESLITEYDN